MQLSTLPASTFHKCPTRPPPLLKVDFRNAFNSLRRDKMLEAVEAYIPQLLPFVHSAYSAPSILLWNDAQISSFEGIQQGDPLRHMLFCLTIHELVSSLVSEFKVFFPTTAPWVVTSMI